VPREAPCDCQPQSEALSSVAFIVVRLEEFLEQLPLTLRRYSNPGIRDRDLDTIRMAIAIPVPAALDPHLHLPALRELDGVANQITEDPLDLQPIRAKDRIARARDRQRQPGCVGRDLVHP
jgi:hypothetical protein